MSVSVTDREIGVYASCACKTLTNIFICQFMTEAYSLRLMLNRFPINDGLTEVIDYSFVDSITLFC